MAYDGVQVEITSAATTPAEVEVPQGAANFTITIYPVTSAEVFTSATAGTAALTMKAAGSNVYETVYQSDGTTAVSIDLTATSPASVTLTNTAARYFKATPSALAGGSAAGIRLAVASE